MLVSKNITNRLNAVSGPESHKRPHISFLEGLPLELLQTIASYLPISAAASFALSSKYICYVVGRQYWHHIRFDPLEYKIFLGFLEKDMPGHWLCTQCLTFHSKPIIKGHYHVARPEWKCAQPLSYISPTMSRLFTYPSTRISWLMVRMVTNRHLFGPEHGERLDTLSEPSCKDSFKDGWGMMSTEACIVANELYVRCQYRITIPSSENFGYIQPIALCPHITWFDPENPVAPIIKFLLNHRNTASSEKCSGLTQCRSCITEFKIQISQFKATGHVLEITYWKNLGAGRSPDDPKWAQQIMCPRIPGLQAAKFSPGSVQSAFESNKHKNSICGVKRNRQLSRSKRVIGQVCAAFS